jgi:hypothetical protein
MNYYWVVQAVISATNSSTYSSITLLSCIIISTTATTITITI